MKIKFYNEEHKNFYMEKTKDKSLNSYNKSLIYLLALIEDTRKHFKEIYNIEKQEINFEVIREPWQTSTSLAIIKFAFNLFNGMHYDLLEDDLEQQLESTKCYTPYYIFAYTNYIDYFLQAVYIRFKGKEVEV